jgi:hypothetical protein
MDCLRSNLGRVLVNILAAPHEAGRLRRSFQGSTTYVISRKFRGCDWRRVARSTFHCTKDIDAPDDQKSCYEGMQKP